jgi:hypothetical protein
VATGVGIRERIFSERRVGVFLWDSSESLSLASLWELSVRRRLNFEPVIVWNALVKDAFRVFLGRVEPVSDDEGLARVEGKLIFRVGRGRNEGD